MFIKLNGREETFKTGATIKDLLIEKGFLPERIIVEHNLRVVPKEEWRKVIIAENDCLEILSFVGGG